MGLVELLVGLLVVGAGAPWVAKFGLAGYQQALKRYRGIVAEAEALDASKPVQVSRADELMTLVHRQQVAEQTAKAIQSEAALALTEATIEKALASGDLGLAKQGIHLALPSAPAGAYVDPYAHAAMQQNTPNPSLGSPQHGAGLANGFEKLYEHGTGYAPTEVLSQTNPFRDNATSMYLGLLRNGYQPAANGMSAQGPDGVSIPVEGELLEPVVATAKNVVPMERARE